MKINSAEFVRGIVGTDPILENGISQVAFVGRSNVGKSSVINSLLQRKDLVKVGDKPGKTKEINFFLVNGKFYCVDLPGYGYARLTPIEKEKIQKMMFWYLMKSGVKPQKVVLVLDVKAGLTDFDREMLRLLSDHHHSFVIAVNKIDKLNQKELSVKLGEIMTDAGTQNIVPYSAKQKIGREELLKKIFDK